LSTWSALFLRGFHPKSTQSDPWFVSLAWSCLRNSTRKSCEFHISHLISELSGACDQRLHHPSAQTYAEGDGFSGDGQAAVMIFLISAGWFGLVGKIEAGKQPSPTDICMFMGIFFGSIRVSCRLPRKTTITVCNATQGNLM